MTSCTLSDYEPFELVTLVRVRNAEGEPTDTYIVLAERGGGERSVRVQVDLHFHQADVHLEDHHGIAPGEPVSQKEWRHAVLRAAVAFLID